MGFASAFFSAWIGGIARRGQIFLGTVGAICAAAGAWQMYAATTHSLSGINTSAVLEGRFSKCLAEFQPKGESRRKEPMDCDRAYAFRNAVGSKKVRVHKTDHATVRYTLADGNSHTATVYEGKVETRGLPVGATFAAVYDPARPDDVRAQPSASSVGFNLAMLLGGLTALGVSLLPQLLGLLGSGGARAEQTADVSTWHEDALKDMMTRQEAMAAARLAAAGSGNRPGRTAPAAGPRRQFGMRS